MCQRWRVSLVFVFQNIHTMKLKVLLAGLLFMSCANQDNQVQDPVQAFTYECSKALQPYVFEYLATLEKYDIKFKKQSFIVVFDGDIMRSNIVGQAQGMFNDNLVYVKVDPRAWGLLTPKQRKHLIFHELSHDIFNIEHTMEVELMRPSLPSPSESFVMDIDKEIDILMKYIKNGQS